MRQVQTVGNPIRRWFRSGSDPAALDISEIARLAFAFREKLETAKRRINERGSGIPWYPYDSIGNFANLERVLRRQRRQLLKLIGSAPVLDIGCADGELSFFLESLGCTVRALDFPATNYNGMLGIQALKQELNSSVVIEAVDLDSQFSLPEQTYGMAFFLGTLYHLKNPYYALETIARAARYCILSTRIARYAPDRRTAIKDLPIAYLLEEGEANQDWTNYWVFSEAGLKRILHRSGWNVLDFATLGNQSASEPASWEGDERAFCLLESRQAEQAGGVRLLEGWHELEYGCWRWTEKNFAALLRRPPGPGCPALKMHLFLPDALLTRLGAVRIAASANGVPLAPERYTQAGEYMLVRRIPAEALAGEAVRLEFQLDSALPPDDSDPRERGVIVKSIRLEW